MADTCSASIATRSAKKAMWTPHSYSQPCRRAVDHELALAQRQRAFVEQATGEHLLEDARALCHGTEQHQRLAPLGHDAVEFGRNLRRIGSFGGGDAGHGRSPCLVLQFM
jgi:hypothetical protein